MELREVQSAPRLSVMLKVISIWGCCVVLGALVILGLSTEASQALPSFARQTGQPCGACHTDFPGLTPFGRRFKIGGYTLGGGKYRTTLFSDATGSSEQPVKAPASQVQTWVPPIAMMAIIGYTHTQ